MTAPTLHLAVQYASGRATPPRDQVRRWVRAALDEGSAPGVGDVTLTLRFVDEDEARTLDRDFRGRDYATNVLTFALGPGPTTTSPVEADIVICVPVVEREAREQGKSFEDHCAHLVVHGTLHACGHDHETDREAGAMEAIEQRVLRRFRIPDPYRIVD